MSTIAICVGRQLGSGGYEIAKSIAAELNFRLCDKEVLSVASTKSGLNKDLFEKSDEEVSSLHSFLANLVPFIGTGDFYGNSVDEESLFRVLSETISEFAENENCVFVGRCAEYILRNKPEMLSIFISADLDDRITRVAERRQIKPEAAKKLIVQNDRRRANFHDFYSSNQWGHASTYDLCINTSRLGKEASTKIVIDFIKKRFDI